MSTSLAAQLQKLAVPQTSALEQDKKRPSLLFDFKEAANFDKNTFYEIGVSGLRELITLNADFEHFNQNLFDITSLNFNRSVQTKEKNKSLDKTIAKFLLKLSPFFLLKSSHKALEWLIYRYSIQDYNKNDFFKLILPYHETNIFVQCLQLFNFETKDEWTWLQPLKKSGVQLTKITLYNHCVSNVGFLKFIRNMVFDAIEANAEKSDTLTTLFAFYCATTIGTLKHLKQVTDPYLTEILPPLLEGYSSKIKDYTASAYMITAKLLQTTKLSDQFLSVLVQKISEGKTDYLRMEATLLLVIIYQLQPDYTTIPFKALRILATADWFTPNLNKLASDGSCVLPLLVPILKCALQKLHLNKYRLLIGKLLSEVHHNDESTRTIIRIMLNSCPKPSKSSNKSEDDSEDSSVSNKEILDWYAKLVKRLETQFPAIFDAIIYEVMHNDNSSKEIKHALKHIMNLMMLKGGPKRSLTIFEKLYHPNADFRLDAVEFLVNKFSKLSEKDFEIMQGAIPESLLDNDPRIVEAVLKLKQKNLLRLLGEDNFIEISVKLLRKFIQDDKYLAATSILINHLTQSHISNNPKLIIPLITLLFPITQPEVNIAKQILTSDFSKKFVRRVETNPMITPQKFCKTIYNAIIENIDEHLVGIDVKSVDLPIYKYIFIILNIKSCNSSRVLKNLKTNLAQSKVVKENKPKLHIANYINFARKQQQLPFQGLIECLKIIIEQSNLIVDDNKLWIDFSCLDETNKFLTTIFVILVRDCINTEKIIAESYHTLFKLFMNKFFPDFNKKLEFFINILTCNETKLIDHKTQLYTAEILIRLLLENKEGVNIDSPVLIPGILIVLDHPQKEIRSAGFRMIECLINAKNKSLLLKKILEYKADIILNPDDLPLILYTFDFHKHEKIFNKLYDLSISSKFPLYLTASLLKILTFLNSVEIFEKLSKFAFDFLSQTVTLDKSNIIHNIILRFNETTASGIKLDSFSWKFIHQAVQSNKIYLHQTKSVASVLIVEQISRELFAKLDFDVQKALIKILTTTATFCDNLETVSMIRKAIKKIDLDYKLLVDILMAMKDVKSNKVVNRRKFRRISEVPSADVLDMKEWKEGITMLEFIQNKKKLTNSSLLLPILFGILKKCLDFDVQNAVEYPKQIILSTILHICIKLKEENQPTTAFNMELIVQCIRTSQNPQTHHHALLVLAETAVLIPEQVLHNIMAIFTFMGSSVLRYDDAYSFQIISKIIETIIPILVENENNVVNVLRVFVDVILDIPEHRRIPLFEKLLTTLNVEKYLWLLLILIFETNVYRGNEPKLLEIATNITLLFPSNIILSSAIKLIEYLKKLPVEIELENTLDLIINCKTPKQFRHFKYILVTFLSSLLSSTNLVNSISVLNNNDLLALEPFYKEIIINILTYIQTTSKIAEKTSNTKYWKVMLHHCYDILDSINALLTTDMFLLVIRGLIVHNIQTVRRKALEILNHKLQNNLSFFITDESENCTDDLLELIPSLLNIIKTVEQTNVEVELELTQQTALLSLKLLIKTLAFENPEKFIPILNYITDLIKSHEISENILASVMLCLGELCSKLRIHAISGSARYMPAVIKVLRKKQQPGLLLLCTITAIQKIVESLLLFLNPYLDKLLKVLTVLSVKWTDSDENKKLQEKLDSLFSFIGTKTPTRLLIPIVAKNYDVLVENNEFLAVGPLMNILSKNLSNITDISNHLSELTQFFFNALQFRTKYSDFNVEVEDYLIKTLTVLVLKLTETTFRPLFYRLFDWAVRSDEKTEKVITFYRLSSNLAQNLKSLFVSFAGHFINNAAFLLDSCNTTKNKSLYFKDDSKNILLVTSILETLKSVFSYDTQNFVDKDKFETLMQPIVDQLENLLGGIDDLTTRAENVLIPCLGQFAVAIGDDVLWKQLNYHVLLKTRHNSPAIRILGLKCFCEIARKIGEDNFLPLLPETIPFLAELLEDEDEQVEQTCQKVVQDLEQILGESLQRYF